MFCLRIPTGELKGLFLMNNLADCPVFETNLESTKESYKNFWGFEIVEVDNLTERNIIQSHGIIPKPINDIED